MADAVLHALPTRWSPLWTQPSPDAWGKISRSPTQSVDPVAVSVVALANGLRDAVVAA